MTLPAADIPRASKLQKWLWRGGLALALFIGTMAVANFFGWFVAPEKRMTTRNVGHDFIAFYTAGTFLREGHLADVYDLEKLKPYQHALVEREGLGIGDSFGPFWNPPIYAWVFVPLSRLNYFTAWWIWFWINVACLSGACMLLILMLKEADMRGSPMPPANVHAPARWTEWALVPLLVVVSLPAIQSLGHGQNTSISLLLLSAIVWFWRKDQRILAGMACGLLFYKPQLALVVAGIVCITLGWRAMVGLAITGILLLAISEITLPGMTRVWSQRLPELVRIMQVDRRYMWDRHVTLKAFWRLLLQGYEVGNTRPAALIASLLSIALLSLDLTIVVVRFLLNPAARVGTRDWLIAATIVAMPLLMPFYFDYDLLLLAVPAVLFAINWMKTGPGARRATDRWMLALWIALYAWLFVNPFVGRATHVNGTVLLLTALAGMLVARAAQSGDARVTQGQAASKPSISPALAI